MPVEAVVGVFVKFLVLLTPFFILSVFVSVTDGLLEKERKKLAKRTTIAIWIVSLVIYFFGNRLFAYMGLTIPAFQAGTGILLMLSGIGLVRGNNSADVPRNPDDIAVVPLAIPTTVGPGTIGTLLVMGNGAFKEPLKCISTLIGIICACVMVGLMLYYGRHLEKLLKTKGLNILSKLTGMYIVALAAQIIFTGMNNMLAEAFKALAVK